MFANLDLTWKPPRQATSSEIPPGRAPAIVRNDPYTHSVLVTGGWATLGSETFEAQIRLARLTTSMSPAATVNFDVTTERGTIDGDGAFTADNVGPDLAIIIELTDEQTSDLPESLATTGGFWDLQQVGGSTFLAGKVKVLDDVTRSA